MTIMEQISFKVIVWCTTYNQSCYVTDALEGFCKQKTSFPFLCCIVDDASTDGEQILLRRFIQENFDISDTGTAYEKDTDRAHVIFARHKANKKCYFAVLLLNENHYSRGISKRSYLQEWGKTIPYTALCEGDDYWISEDKLERQVAYLETHSDCTLTYHASQVVFTEDYVGLRNIPKFAAVKETYDFVDTIKGYPFQTATVIYRSELNFDPLYLEAIKEIGYSKILFMIAAYRGKMHGFPEQMSVYRKNNGGISNLIDKGPLALQRISSYTRIACLFPSREKKIMHRVYILYLIWESYVLTPFSDRQFFSLLLKEAKYSPITSIHLFLRYIKRKLIILIKL